MQNTGATSKKSNWQEQNQTEIAEIIHNVTSNGKQLKNKTEYYRSFSITVIIYYPTTSINRTLNLK